MNRKIPTKLKFIVGLTIFFIFLWMLYLLARHNAEKGYQRPTSVLLDQYYQLRKLNQPEAKRALELILQQDPHNQIALTELQHWNSPQATSPFPAPGSLFSLNTPGTTQAFSLTDILPQSLFLREPEVSFSELLNSAETIQPPKIESLFIDYYNIKPTNPEKAMTILHEIIEKDPSNNLAYAELGYFYLNNHKNDQALACFEKAYELVPIPQLAMQIAYLLADNKEFLLAQLYLQQSIKLSNNETSPDTQKMLITLHQLMNPFITRLLTITPQKIAPNTEYTQLMNQYFDEKKIDPEQAWLLLKQIIARYPDDIMALKEAGYYTLAKKNYTLSLAYFKHAYTLTNDPLLAMQVGYILNTLGENAHAYQYFWYATRATNEKISYNAELAMDNLSGLQTKIIPNPFFVNFYYAPFVFSRFALLVNPLIVRAGITLEEAHKLQVYAGFRYTKDNRSSSGQIPQIYETNQAVAAVGASVYPFTTKIPLVVFGEVGKAYSLINVQPLVQNDVRAGAAFYTEWGKKPSFSPTVRWSHDLIGNLYASAIYYSQFNNDVIGDFRFNEGVRILQFRAATITPYITGHLILDTQHQFYNNILEIGPGIAFRPTTRYNFVLKLEALKGFYLPVNSPSVNPYGPTYRNNVVQLVSYFEF